MASTLRVVRLALIEKKNLYIDTDSSINNFADPNSNTRNLAACSSSIKNLNPTEYIFSPEILSITAATPVLASKNFIFMMRYPLKMENQTFFSNIPTSAIVPSTHSNSDYNSHRKNSMKPRFQLRNLQTPADGLYYNHVSDLPNKQSTHFVKHDSFIIHVKPNGSPAYASDGMSRKCSEKSAFGIDGCDRMTSFDKFEEGFRQQIRN